MNRWVGKVAVVTGASSGIGAATAVDLVNAGVIVVGLARRVERVDELKSKISSTATGKLHAFKCDVSNEEDVKTAFAWIIENIGGVDILVNNAGILRQTSLLSADNSVPVREVINTNVLGIVWCTREAFKSMKQREVDGHIIVINSNSGHTVPNFGGRMPSLNMYPPSKFAVTAMTEVLRQELQTEGTKKTKITSISPGAVLTEMIPKEAVELFKCALLQPEDISSAVLYVLGTPPHVQVHELNIKTTGENY